MKGRQLANLKQHRSGNISGSDEVGDTRDLAAAKAGLGSGKTLEAAQVVLAKGTPSKGTPGPFPGRVIRAAPSDCCATFPRGGLCCWPQAGCSLCCGDEHGFNSSGFPPHRIRAASWVPGGVANTKRGYKWGYKKKNESTKPRIHAGFKASFSSRQLIGSGAFSLSCAVPWSITASQHFVGISVGRWRCRLPTAVQGCQALAGRDAPWVRRYRHAPGCGRWPWRGTWLHRPGPAGW